MCYESKPIPLPPVTPEIIEAAIAQAKIDARKMKALREDLDSRGSFAAVHGRSREDTIRMAYERVQQLEKNKVDTKHVKSAEHQQAVKDLSAMRAHHQLVLAEFSSLKVQHEAAMARIAELEIKNNELQAKNPAVETQEMRE
ncbi:uncharacterized protein BKA78DRAFT_340576 [Phyllosticta capitalensis]|uniref:uncharacterized protein n=1 Tax=Phyllosticta capitalensis TaxID=121624 RepID=UPI00312F6C6B